MTSPASDFRCRCSLSSEMRGSVIHVHHLVIDFELPDPVCPEQATEEDGLCDWCRAKHPYSDVDVVVVPDGVEVARWSRFVRLRLPA